MMRGMDESTRATAYEAPSVTDLGRLEDLTKAGKNGSLEGAAMKT